MSRKAMAGWLRPITAGKREPADASLRSVSRSHVGRVRTINEDRVLDMTERRLWAVADGMGGHAAGDVAAEAAIAALQLVAHDERISVEAVETALAKVNRDLHARTRRGASMSGATIVVMFENRKTVTMMWAGDCRAYRLRDRHLTQLTRDHSVVQELLDAGALQPGQAAQHPHAHVVTRALGAAENLVLDKVVSDIKAGDLFLLCSDGLAVAPERLREAPLRGLQALSSKADALIADALAAGGKDNVSLILIEHD